MKRLVIFLFTGLLVVVVGCLLYNGAVIQESRREAAKYAPVPSYEEALELCNSSPWWASQYGDVGAATIRIDEGTTKVTYRVFPGNGYPYDDHFSMEITITKQIIHEKGFLWFYDALTYTQTECESRFSETTIDADHSKDL